MSEEELKRVLGNPENIIVSDSLKDRVDFGLEEENPSDLKITIGNIVFAGKFLKISSKRENEQSLTKIFFSTQNSIFEKIITLKLQEECTAEISGKKIEGKINSFEFFPEAGEFKGFLELL